MRGLLLLTAIIASGILISCAAPGPVLNYPSEAELGYSRYPGHYYPYHRYYYPYHPYRKYYYPHPTHRHLYNKPDYKRHKHDRELSDLYRKTHRRNPSLSTDEHRSIHNRLERPHRHEHQPPKRSQTGRHHRGE